METAKTIKVAIGQEQQPNTEGIKVAIEAVHIARESLLAFARERKGRQLSINALASISQELQSIEHRMAAYDKN